MKIFDCSKSTKPEGYKDNKIIAYLKQYAGRFGHEFVPCWEDADVIFTNDIFPLSFNGKRKVKRMDGIFSRVDNMCRNNELNKAAEQADHVIFISNYSRDCYFKQYNGNILSYTVICNEVDPHLFYPKEYPSKKLNKIIAVADRWNRPEKRLSAILDLAKDNLDVDFIIVGDIDYNLGLKNVTQVSYKNNIAEELRKADAMISLFYRDPYPKTMVEGIYCGLPILYTDSGGQSEMPVVGVSISDPFKFEFDTQVPQINAFSGWQIFKKDYYKLAIEAIKFDGRNRFERMLNNYFKSIKGE